MAAESAVLARLAALSRVISARMHLEHAMSYPPGPYPDPDCPIEKWQAAHAHIAAAETLLGLRRSASAEAYRGYCVRCKVALDFVGEVRVSDSGRRIATGSCPACGTRMNRILGRATPRTPIVPFQDLVPDRGGFD